MKYFLITAMVLIGAGLAQARCPDGFVLNVGLQKCESVPACLPGFTLHPEKDVCVMKKDDGICPDGSSPNKEDKTCESSVVCPKIAAFNPDIGKCVEK
jgi:hypothetical protein